MAGFLLPVLATGHTPHTQANVLGRSVTAGLVGFSPVPSAHSNLTGFHACAASLTECYYTVQKILSINHF